MNWRKVYDHLIKCAAANLNAAEHTSALDPAWGRYMMMSNIFVGLAGSLKEGMEPEVDTPPGYAPSRDTLRISDK